MASKATISNASISYNSEFLFLQLHFQSRYMLIKIHATWEEQWSIAQVLKPYILGKYWMRLLDLVWWSFVHCSHLGS